MKKTIAALLAVLFLTAISCDNKPKIVTELIAGFDVSNNPCYAGTEIHFTNTSTGGELPYSCTWNIDGNTKTGDDVRYTFTKNGTYTVVLNVTDGSGQSAQKKKLVVVDPSPVAEQGTISVKWVVKTAGYNSISTPAVADDGSVYATTRANKLYKINSTGTQLWAKDIFNATTDAYTLGTPSVDTDGTVFIGAGTTGPEGNVVAFNPDGTVKWRYNQWWASSGDPKPSYQASIVAIKGDNVYFGHVGTSGCVVSADKATGARNGFCAPTGGARTGITIDRNGVACWYGGWYGLHAIKTATLDNGGNTKCSDLWALWTKDTDIHYPTQIPMGGIAVFDYNGNPCFAGMASDRNGTRIYIVKSADGSLVKEYYIDNTADQDQGGVVLTSEGYIVASLAYSAGQDNGGIVIYDPATETLVGRYNVQEKVAGSCAVDNNGNIHFGTESGFYYVVNPECETLLKADIATVISAAAPAQFSDLTKAKIWSSVVIGDDGTVYLQFTDDNDRNISGIVAFNPKNASEALLCTGPADSQWPMFGGNRRHTNVQKAK